jgi:hypothetical protein
LPPGEPAGWFPALWPGGEGGIEEGFLGEGGWRVRLRPLRGGKAGITEFTDLRRIIIQDGPLHYPM